MNLKKFAVTPTLAISLVTAGGATALAAPQKGKPAEQTCIVRQGFDQLVEEADKKIVEKYCVQFEGLQKYSVNRLESIWTKLFKNQGQSKRFDLAYRLQAAVEEGRALRYEVDSEVQNLIIGLTSELSSKDDGEALAEAILGKYDQLKVYGTPGNSTLKDEIKTNAEIEFPDEMK